MTCKKTDVQVREMQVSITDLITWKKQTILITSPWRHHGSMVRKIKRNMWLELGTVCILTMPAYIFYILMRHTNPLARHRDLTPKTRERKKKKGIDRHGICCPRRCIMTCSDRDVTLHACGGPEMDFGETKFGRVTFQGDHYGLANYSSKQGVLCKLEQPGWDQGLKMSCCSLRKV